MASVFVGIAVVAAAASGGSLLDGLQPGHWVEVPGSRLRDVGPDPSPPGNTGLDAVTSAWSGAAFDVARGRLLVWGGGHADYAGNELYAFDIGTMAWERVWGPTPNSQIPDLSSPVGETYLDGSPAARHTYDGLVYLPPPYDALWEQGGSLTWDGRATWATWQFDLSQGHWTRRADASSGFPTTYGVNAQYDPLTGRVIWRESDLLSEYDPGSDVWTNRIASGGWVNDATVSALDPSRRLMIFVGKGPFGGRHGDFFAYDIDTHDFFSPAASGSTAIIDATAPGVAYDPVADRVVAWKGGADVYTLDLDTWVWRRVPPAPTNAVVPGDPTGTGTYGRWQYVPGKDVFVLYSDVDDSVFFYRLGVAPAVTSLSPVAVAALTLVILALGASILSRRRGAGTFVRGACLAAAAGTMLPAVPASAATIEITPASDWVGLLNDPTSLAPGDEVVFGAGVYSTSTRLSLGQRGTAGQRIILRAADGAHVTITRPNANQNVLNLEGAQYLTLKGFEITGGSTGVRINSGGGIQPKFIVLDGNHIHHTGNAAVSANIDGNTYEGMHFLNNEVDHTSAEGEGFYLGCNYNGCQFFDGIIERNYIHDLNGAGVTQGDGIEIKDGSFNNIVRDNVIHDTNFPGVIVYGVEGQGARNVIERNVLWNIRENGIQAAADAIIRNNIIFSAAFDGIHSQNHQGAVPGNLTIENNTVHASGNAIDIGFPSGGAYSGPIEIANNALYPGGAFAIEFPFATGMTISSNVGTGLASGGLATSQFDASGDLLTDFVDFLSFQAFPAVGSRLIAAGDVALQPADDFNTTSRAGSADVGAYVFDAAGNPGWQVGLGFKFMPAPAPIPLPASSWPSSALLAALLLLAGTSSIRRLAGRFVGGRR